MAEARRLDAWGRTSSLLAMLHNVNCSDERHLVKPSDYNPMIPRKPKKFSIAGAVAQLAAHTARMVPAPGGGGLIGGGAQPATLKAVSPKAPA